MRVLSRFVQCWAIGLAVIFGLALFVATAFVVVTEAHQFIFTTLDPDVARAVWIVIGCLVLPAITGFLLTAGQDESPS